MTQSTLPAEPLPAISQPRLNVGEDADTAAILRLINNYLLMAGLAALADVVAVGQANSFDDVDLQNLLARLRQSP